MSESILDRLDQLEQAATEGPWPGTLKGILRFGSRGVRYFVDTDDAELIAFSRNHLRALIDAARALCATLSYVSPGALPPDVGRRARETMVALFDAGPSVAARFLPDNAGSAQGAGSRADGAAEASLGHPNISGERVPTVTDLRPYEEIDLSENVVKAGGLTSRRVRRRGDR